MTDDSLKQTGFRYSALQQSPEQQIPKSFFLLRPINLKTSVVHEKHEINQLFAWKARVILVCFVD